MKAKLDGARPARANAASTPHLRKLMKEAEVEVEVAPDPVSITWTQTAHELSAAKRRDRIGVAAYYLAEARGFATGHEAEDWLIAQAQVDAADAGSR